MFALGMHFRREREAERRAALLRKKQSVEYFGAPPPANNTADHYLFNSNNNDTNANTSSKKSGKKSSTTIGHQDHQIANLADHQHQKMSAAKYVAGQTESRQKRFSCPTGPQYSSLLDNNRSPQQGNSSKLLDNYATAKMSASCSAPQRKRSSLLTQDQILTTQPRNSNDSGCCSSRRERNDDEDADEIDLNEISTEIDTSMENLKLNNNDLLLRKKSSLDGGCEKSLVKIVKSSKKTIFSKRSGSTDNNF